MRTTYVIWDLVKLGRCKTPRDTVRAKIHAGTVPDNTKAFEICEKIMSEHQGPSKATVMRMENGEIVAVFNRKDMKRGESISWVSGSISDQ